MTTRIDVERESDRTVARLVALTQQTRNDGQRVISAFDPLVTIDIKDQNLRDGVNFYAFSARLSGNLLANNASIDIVVTPSPGTNVCMNTTFQCGGDAEFYVHENVTDISGGTLFVPINRNRRSTNTSQVGVLLQPTVTVNGVIYEEVIIGGSGGNAGGGAVDGIDFILKPDVSYLFRLKNVSGQSRLAELQLTWCEPT
jgi:hypothetical protein